MLRTVHLHGRLKREFGAKHRFDVRTAAEALRALNCAFPGQFVKALEGGSFELIAGPRKTGFNLDIDLVNELRLGASDLHLIPVAEGAANGKGTAKTILGVALIGGAIFMSGGTLAAPLSMMGNAAVSGLGITWGNIAMVGLGLTLAGASSLLTQPAPVSKDGDADKSHAFNGPGNTGTQGDAIPLIYGRVMTGSVPVSFDSDIEDVGAYQGGSGSLAV
jgi:predicted phage tail protein